MKALLELSLNLGEQTRRGGGEAQVILRLQTLLEALVVHQHVIHTL